MTRLEVFKTLAKKIQIGKRDMVRLFFLRLMNLFFESVNLFLYTIFVNEVLIRHKMTLLIWIVLLYCINYVFVTFGIMLSKKYSNRLILRYEIHLKKNLLNKTLMCEELIYNKGDIKERIENDSKSTAQFYTTHILEFIFNILYCVVMISILLYYDWRLAILGFVFIPVAFFIFNIFGKSTKKSGEELRENQVKNELFLFDSIVNWKDIKMNNLEEIKLKELNEQYKKIRHIWFINQLYMHIGITFSWFSKNFITKLYIFFLGGIFLLFGMSNIGDLLIFVNFYGQLFERIQNLGEAMINYKKDLVKVEKVIEMLNITIDLKADIEIYGKQISVSGLTYCYNEEEKFSISNVSFEVKNGEHLAIAGESGSGKSTIAKLLTGQLKPDSGYIKIGGVDINTVNSSNILKKITFITQEPVFFNMTIRENLLLIKPNATDMEIINSCRKAGIYDYIKKLPYGLETVIGENGTRISGGQRQRLAIARAFLQETDILIMDEITSALDNNKEKDIIENIKQLSIGKTTISIAHRLSSILDCDRVLLIKNGEVVALDTHENLRKNNKYYNSLFNKQCLLNEKPK